MTTGESGGKRYWDSTNWISVLAEDEAYRADICQNILNDMVAGKLTVITSPVYYDFGSLSSSYNILRCIDCHCSWGRECGGNHYRDEGKQGCRYTLSTGSLPHTHGESKCGK